MANPVMSSLESLLRQIAAAAPQPWYPSLYAQETGTARDSLDEPLQHLRLGGLIRLTDWEPGKGQGYVLTVEGQQALSQRHYLTQLQNGEVPTVLGAAPDPLPQREVRLGDWERGEALREAFEDARPPRVTQLLIGLNVLVFVAGTALALQTGIPLGKFLSDSDPQILLRIGALQGAFLERGQWWRLLTTCFVHGGLMHIGMNMYALWLLGPWAERLWGRARFLVLYLLAGIGGSCGAMLANPAVTMVGASGAICGILGAEAGWLWLNYRFLRPDIIARWTRNLLINTLLIAFISSLPGISAAGHFGGAAGGLAAAFLLNTQRFGISSRRRLALVGLIALPLLCIGLVLRSMQANPAAWQNAEHIDIVTRIAPLIDEGLAGTVRDYEEQVAPLLEMHRNRRDPAAVARARAIMAARQSKLDAERQRIQQMSPYSSREIEDARLLGIAYLDACLELCRRAERALEAGEHWRKDEQAATEQFKGLQQIRKQWDQMRGRRTP